MKGRALVKWLDAAFRRLETPFTVTFDSPEDARALLLWISVPHLRRGSVWSERLGPAVCAIARELGGKDREALAGVKE